MNKPVLIQYSSNKKIEYRYDAAGNRISKYIYNNSSSVTKSIEYIGGYVIENDILSYYSMAEGRVRNEGGGFGLSMKMEYFITDQQGNTRVSFEDNGSGAAVLRQENSYYAFGMQMAGGYTPGSNPNKKLYNAGSEWQDDIDGLADYYSTFFREYDPVIGRFNGVDPMAEATDNITTYAYSNNNPVNFNDPLGNTKQPTLAEQMQAEYRAWHDPQYGDNSSWATLDIYMSMWGWGDWSGGGGGGMSQSDFYSTYAGLKMRINDFRSGTKHGFNSFGEFGYWNTSYVFGEVYWKDGVGYIPTKRETSWVSEGGSGQGFGNPLDVGLVQSRSGGEQMGRYKGIGGFGTLLMQTGQGKPNGENKKSLLKFVGLRDGWIPEFESSLLDDVGGGSAAMTPGPFIIYPTGGSKFPEFNKHEPGHVIQFWMLGPVNYTKFVIIPSLLSAGLDPDNHAKYPWEQSADRLWNLYQKLFH